MDALVALAALIREAENAARMDLDEKDDPADDRNLGDFFAERLVRYAPSYGLSIRLDDGSEIPASDHSSGLRRDGHRVPA